MCQSCTSKRTKGKPSTESEYAILFYDISLKSRFSPKFCVKKWYRDYKYEREKKREERRDIGDFHRLKYGNKSFSSSWYSLTHFTTSNSSKSQFIHDTVTL